MKAAASMRLEGLVARLRGMDRPLPEVAVEHGPTIRGWVFRLALVAAVLLFVVAAAARTSLAGGIVSFLALATAAWAAIRPGPTVSHTTVFLAGLMLLGAPGPFVLDALWLAPFGYVVTRLGWWAGHVGPRARIEVAALGRASVRDGVVIVLAVALGALAASLAGRPIGVVVAMGSAALAALAWLALRRHDEDETPQI